MLIIPVYNERPGILKTVLEEARSCGYIVVVVDDGSATPVDIKPATGLVVLRHAVNLGQGAALQTGFDYALQQQAGYVITFDADGQHDINDTTALLAPLIQGEADVTLGSRFLENKDEHIPAARKKTLRLARRINNLLTGLPLTDVHNGIRAFTRKALQQIHLKENRMAHATEIIAQIRKAKLRYKEIPVHIRYTDYSMQKGQSAFGGIRIFFDLLLHKLFQ